MRVIERLPAWRPVRVIPASVGDGIFLGVLLLLFVCSGAVTVTACVSMPAMDGMPMPGGGTMSMTWMRARGASWPRGFADFLGMWTPMMVAMMLPSLSPALWRYRRAVGRAGALRPVRLATLAGIGYFLVWTALGAMVFPLGAALARVATMQPMLVRAMPWAAGVIVLLAGAFQLSACKRRRLAGCAVIPRGCGAFPPDAVTAWRTGLCLGLQCGAGCLSFTVVLLVLGVMDLRVMASVTAAITAERLLPARFGATRAIGVAILVIGGVLLARAGLD